MRVVHFTAQGTLNQQRSPPVLPDSLRQNVNENNPRAFLPRAHALPPADAFRWRFPAGSVSVVELDCRRIGGA